MTAAHRWPRRALALAIVVELFGGGAFLYARSLDTVTVVARDDLVEQFRERQRNAAAPGEESPSQGAADPGGAPAPGPGGASGSASGPTQPGPTVTTDPGSTPDPEDSFTLPAAGIYTYATTGYETVSALGGARHDYPSETTVTLTHEGCGLRVRWDALEERWDEWENCVTEAGEEWKVFTTFHEFFGQQDLRHFQCEPGSLIRPRRTEVGATWVVRCSDETSWFQQDTVVIGLETMSINGQAVDVWHERGSATSGGDTRGGGSYEFWIAADTGLIVRMAGAYDSEADSPFGAGGPVDYHEEFDMVLTSLQPLT